MNTREQVFYFIIVFLEKRQPHLLINNEMKAHTTRGLYNDQTKQNQTRGDAFRHLN